VVKKITTVELGDMAGLRFLLLMIMERMKKVLFGGFGIEEIGSSFGTAHG